MFLDSLGLPLSIPCFGPLVLAVIWLWARAKESDSGAREDQVRSLASLSQGTVGWLPGRFHGCLAALRAAASESLFLIPYVWWLRASGHGLPTCLLEYFFGLFSGFSVILHAPSLSLCLPETIFLCCSLTGAVVSRRFYRHCSAGPPL